MNFKKIVLTYLILLSTTLFSVTFDADDYKLSSFGLKSYSKPGLIKSEVSYTAENIPTKIVRYYYDKKDLLSKVEYYAVKSTLPEYKKYFYKKNKLVEIRFYNTAGRVKLTTKLFYKDGNEIKKEHYDSNKRLKSSQKNYYNDKNQLIKIEYLDAKNKVYQHNLFYHDENGREIKVEVFKKGSLLISFKNEYDTNGNKKAIYYYNDQDVLNMIEVNIFNKNNDLAEYKLFKKIN